MLTCGGCCQGSALLQTSPTQPRSSLTAVKAGASTHNLQLASTGMAAAAATGPDTVPMTSSTLWPKLLQAGDSSISFDHLDRSDLQLLLSARGVATDGTKEQLLKRLQATIMGSHGSCWASQPLSCAAPSREFGASIVHNGDLYMFGGIRPGGEELPLGKMLVKFEALTGSFEGQNMRIEDESDSEEDSLLDNYPMPASGATTLVYDDKLWVFGGMSSPEGGDNCNNMWAYDFFARQWSLIDQKGVVPAPRTRACAALHDGKMLIYGYQCDPDDEYEKEDGRTIPVFDFHTHTWSRMNTTGTSPPNQTYVDGLAVWADTYLYAFVQPHDTPNATALIYRLDLSKKRWAKVKTVGKSPEVRGDCAVGQLNEYIIINGGCPREDAADPSSWEEGCNTNETWLFSLLKHEWQQLDASHLLARSKHCAVPFHDSMLFMGGEMYLPDNDEDEDTQRLQGPIQAIHLEPVIPQPKESAGLANIDLSTKLRAFYQSPAHADIQLRAGSEVFPAHKIVLAAQSPTFERMFESGMAEQTSAEVTIQGMQPPVLKALLAYMYGCLSDIEPGMVHDLFRAADHYQVEGLRGELLELMITNIDTDNAAAFALLADDYGIVVLHDACVTFASSSSNKLAVAGSESFLKLMTARPQLAQKFITGVMASEDMPSKRSATKLGKRRRR